MIRLRLDPSVIRCASCGEYAPDAYFPRIGGIHQAWCVKCFDKESISLTFTHFRTHDQNNHPARVLPIQTATDALDDEGSSLVGLDYNRSGGPDYEMVLERTGQVLPHDKTLSESGVKDGDVLIVRQAAKG